jgi:hypothetical protein
LGNGGYYWISGPRKDQNDRLTGGKQGVEIGEDVAKEYLELIARYYVEISVPLSKFGIALPKRRWCFQNASWFLS